MRSVIVHYGGGHSVARTPADALMLWYFAQLPKRMPTNPEPLTVYKQPGAIAHGSQLLTAVIAHVERTLNKTLPMQNPELWDIAEPLLSKGYQLTCATTLVYLMQLGLVQSIERGEDDGSEEHYAPNP